MCVLALILLEVEKSPWGDVAREGILT